jgi:tetratricopeptide (TPR) repeat protein
MKCIFSLISAGLLVLLPHLPPAGAGTPKEVKHVRVLHSEEKAHPAHELPDRGIRSAFDANPQFDVRLYDEYLGGFRFPGPAHTRAMADYLDRKYGGLKIDAILTVYPAAADFLLRQATGLFPDTPIVANQASKADADNLKRSPQVRPITGTMAGENASGLLNSILRLRPGTRRVARVGGTSANNFYTEQIRFFPAKVNLAMLCSRLGRNAEAEALLREVARDHPELYDVRYSLGLLLAEEKKYIEAEPHLAAAARGMPDRSRVSYNLGILYDHLQAEAARGRAVALEPDNVEYLHAMAQH